MSWSAVRSDGGSTAAVDELRMISLPALLVWHGLDPKPEGLSFRVKTDRYNLVVTGNRWFDNKTGKGGVGAIDLQMHLSGEDFSSSCQTLARQFRNIAAHPPSIVFPIGKPAASDRLPFPQLMAKYAVRDEGNWPMARAYLVETRKIEPAIVDELHAVGSIYANNHRPNPALVFLHRTDCGKVIGATLRDTRHESSFRPTLGNKLSGWFSVGNIREAHSVVAVESPVEALSYYTLFGSAHDRLAVASCSGSFVSDELMWQSYDRRQRFVVALNNDAAGERGWQKAWDETVDWAGFKISSDCPQGNDWNADLLSRVEKSSRCKAQSNPLTRAMNRPFINQSAALFLRGLRAREIHPPPLARRKGSSRSAARTPQSRLQEIRHKRTAPQRVPSIYSVFHCTSLRPVTAPGIRAASRVVVSLLEKNCMSNSFQKQNLPLRVVLNRVGEATLNQYGAVRTSMDSPEAIHRFWLEVVADDPSHEPEKEHLVAVFLNTKLKLIAYHVVSVGSINEAIAHPREIFRAAILAGSYRIVLMHNHPSGDPTPSRADCIMTKRINEAGEILGIALLDHVIVGSSEEGGTPYHSFREAGLL